MGPIGHTIITLPIAASVYVASHDAVAAGATFVAGVCIDVDHGLDYFLARGFKVDLAAIREGAYFREAGRAIVFLHSYELILIAALSALLLGSPVLGLGVALGALVHLATDAAFYKFTPLCYSLAYRAARGFSLDAFRASTSAHRSTPPQ